MGFYDVLVCLLVIVVNLILQKDFPLNLDKWMMCVLV